MEATHNHQGILSSPLSEGNEEEEERMIERVHAGGMRKGKSTPGLPRSASWRMASRRDIINNR
jgi:hypothetical protein